MKKTIFGKIMTNYRQKYHLQQSAICMGICSTATYLRAEIEERVVDFVVQETLLARVGQSATNFEIMLDDEEFEMWSERLAIRAAWEAMQMESLRKKVASYRRKNAHLNKLHEQFCQYYELKLAQSQSREDDRICERALSALSITKGPEEYPDSRKNLYTPMELDLLLILLRHHHGIWKMPENREKCYTAILEYLNQIPIMESREEIQGFVWLELLHLYDKVAHEKLLDSVEKALEYLRQGSSLLRLAEAYFIKARCLCYRMQEQGDSAGNNLLKECQNACAIAYNIYEVMECAEKLAEVESFCESS